MLKHAWPALAVALVLMGCVQLNGSPAMRPHARAVEAAAAPAPAASQPGAERVSHPSEHPPAKPTPTAVSPPADPVPPTPAPTASWEPADTPLSDLTPAGWFPPLAGLTASAIIGRFGDPRDGGARRHDGIDILAERGTPVVAPVAGTVIASGRRGRAGNLVILLADDGEEELYFAHLDSREVARGHRVRAGQRIGTVGTTGNAAGTSPHLHFEVRVGRGPVDPVPFLLE